MMSNHSDTPHLKRWAMHAIFRPTLPSGVVRCQVSVRPQAVQYSSGSRIVVTARLPESSAASVMIQTFSPSDVR